MGRVFATPASLISMILLLCLMQSGCSTTVTLEDVITAAELAVSTVAAADPAVPGIVIASKYLDAVGQAADCAIAERQSSDPPAVQATKIGVCASAAVLPVLPPGTPTEVTQILNKVATALAGYLSGLAAVGTDSRVLVKLDGGSDLPSMHVRVATMRAKLPAAAHVQKSAEWLGYF